MKDWKGTGQFILSGNNRKENSEINDYYATEPRAVELLLENEKFNNYIWECACGGGHISKVLSDNGYDVKSSDIINRGYPNTEIIDFLKVNKEDIAYDFSRDIITNPPYKYAKEFVEKALELSMDSTKIAMFLKLTFLEGKARKSMFEKYPPKKVYVFSSRVCCGKNGDFKPENNAVAYAWFVWVKGFNGEPIIKWIN
ncbi:MAG: NAD(P)-dependent oxidoreductase [Clostridia bacterium]|nr:NAD(P)-dependent oxidoreductase [Clostridia bacterium]